jgi:hypothetical protein
MDGRDIPGYDDGSEVSDSAGWYQPETGPR